MKRYKKKAPRETVIDYMGGKANVFAMLIFLIVVVTAGVIWIEHEAAEVERARYIDSWEITENRNIKWTWAGRDGYR